MLETLGVLAHRGGLVVQTPELSVGIVRAVSRPTGLSIELLARRPLDRRTAGERQADIRAGRGATTVAPRRLLPPYDEGIDLRVGWLDHDGRAHWEFGSRSSSSGDHFGGTHGPSLRTVLRFPPLYDRVSVVLAWPEIGFTETVLDLPLPDRETVAVGTLSIWDTPPVGRPVPEPLRYHADEGPPEDPDVETGRVVAGPLLLSRDDTAAIVLGRLTEVGGAVSMEISSVATFLPSGLDVLDPGASVAVVQGRDAVRLRPGSGSAGGSDRALTATIEFTARRPAGDVLPLVVAWPAAGLSEVYAELPLSGER